MIRISTIIISIFTTFALFAQKLDHDNTSKWFAGLNAGAAWNSTDVKNKTKIGWGFVVGRSFNYQAGRPISFDLRLRYLSARYQGQNLDTTNLAPLGATYNGPLANYKNGPGYTVHNFENRIHHLGLEASIHLNNLADRTGWDPYVFGGLNFTWNKAKGNLVDNLAIDSLGIYDYSAGKFTQTDFDDMLDDDYETPLEGGPQYNIDFMPSVGFGIGYHLSPRLSIGLEHKTTFTLNDRFDGIVSGDNDLYHYTGAYLKFRFKGRKHREEPITDPDPVNPTPVTPVDPAPCENPRIRITAPSHSGTTVTQQLYNFRADVSFVGNQNEITLLVNGVNTNFVYSQQIHKIEAQIQLTSGKNEIELRAQNTCGRDAQIVTINYQDCFDPVVQLNNVSGNSVETERSSFQLIGNVSNATNVQVNVNGSQFSGVVFNPSTGALQANIPLMRGMNTVRIVATGTCGTITRNITINYNECATPEVSFQRGNGALISIPANSSANFTVDAFVFNVENKNQIQVQLNGQLVPFTFNVSTGKLIANVTLRANNNNIRIVANTSCGRDEQFINVNRIICNSPQISVLIPRTQTSETTSSSAEIKVQLTQITSRSQISITVNGIVYNGGSYDPYRREFTSLVNLRDGSNSIQIVASNDCGTDTEVITINSKPCNVIDLQFVEPINNSVTENNSVWFRSYAYGANSINELALFVNGAQQSIGSFNTSTKLFQKNIQLNAGVNTIKLVGRNACGTTNETITVTYSPCTPPVLTQLLPATNPFYTTAASFDIQSTIQNISGVQNVQMTVNGNLDNSGARYIASNQTYYNSTPLQVGNNVIRIIATNGCSSQTLEFIIVREVVNDPVEDEIITICHPTAGANSSPLTMDIPISQWPAYQRQGATLGPCPEPKMTICFNGKTQEILVSQWLAYQQQGATKGACPEATMTICFVNKTMEIPVSQWSVYQSQGATQGPCPTVDPDIVICLNGRTMTIKTSQWDSYASQGATKGECPEPTMTICYQNRNMEIPVSRWLEYQNLGATKGECPEATMKVCFGNKTIEIPISQWSVYQSQGAVRGECPPEDPEIKICYNGRSMMIKTSQWAQYQNLGATKGECPEATMKICYQNRNMEIPVSRWLEYQNLGATKGECPEGTMKICFGNKTIEIPISQWSVYQSQGAVRGECPPEDPEIKICYNGRSMMIKTSQWAQYQNLGATKGECPEATMKICYQNRNMEIPVSRWLEYQNLGATKGECPEGTMKVCFGNKTIEILVSQWPVYQGQGAVRGECPPEDPEIKICYNGRSMMIKTSQWAQYQNLGATKGECPEATMKICYQNRNMEIPVSQWPTFQRRGATKGDCPEATMKICYQNKNMEIPVSQWPTFERRGATKGECPVDPKIKICLNGKTKMIRTSEWPIYLRQGATKGDCPVEREFKICLNGKSKTIKTSEWPAYLAQGATKGDCPAQEETMKVCLNNRSITIPVSSWPEYEAQGATKGECPPSRTPSRKGMK